MLSVFFTIITHLYFAWPGIKQYSFVNVALGPGPEYERQIGTLPVTYATVVED